MSVKQLTGETILEWSDSRESGLPLFWTFCDPSHGFQSQGGPLTCTLTCVL